MSEREDETCPQMPEGQQPAPPLSAALDFDLSPVPDGASTLTAPPPQAPAESAATANSTRRKGVLGALGGIGVVLAKFWSVILSVLMKWKVLLVGLKFLSLGKLLLAGSTMLISMFFYSFRFGWPFAIGLVLLILIHESGHALAARALGHPVGKMVFVPGMGAFVTTGGARNAVEDAFIGIMGPVAGTLGGLVCYGLYVLTGHPLWLVLAWFDFWINLLNLTPAPPLDGGWLAPIFSPKLLLPGIALLFFTFRHNPMVWVLALLSLPRILFAWKHGSQSPYYQTRPRDRWIYGLAWAGLAAFLALANTLTHYQMLSFVHRGL